MAARTLAKAGKKVTLLEARNRCGGRIHSISDNLSIGTIKLGAEFVHGDLPITLSLLKDAGIACQPVHFEMWHYRDGQFENGEPFMEGWGLLAEKLGKIEKDISINDFLENEFKGELYDTLKASVRGFASGYDTADPNLASTFALRNEWLNEDEDAQYRIEGGYGAIIDYLEKEFIQAGGVIHLNSAVKSVHWKDGEVNVITDEGLVYEATQIILALPLGILQAGEQDKAAIEFHPPIPGHINAINGMGFGAVIKILLEFDEPFWEDAQTEELAGKSLANMSFLLSDEQIPAWWTQAPKRSPLLTGWLGGPPATAKKDLQDGEILAQSLQSISNIFKRDMQQLKDKLVAYHIINWTNEPFTLGSYAYDKVETAAARKVLTEPVENTLFFAGEYLYDGAVMGTVEAALSSGEIVAKKMLND